MVIGPPTVYWMARSWQARQAAHDFGRASAFYEEGTATFDEVYVRSRRLRDAQLAIPFAELPLDLLDGQYGPAADL